MLYPTCAFVLDCLFCSGGTAGQNTQNFFPSIPGSSAEFGFPHLVENLCESCAFVARKALQNESLGTNQTAT